MLRSVVEATDGCYSMLERLVFSESFMVEHDPLLEEEPFASVTACNLGRRARLDNSSNSVI